MSEDTRKVGIQVVGDASPVKEAFSEVKDAGRDMAQSVAQSSQAAGKAVEGIGAGGAASAQKVDAATKNMIGAVQRATVALEAGGRSTAKYYELLGQQRGISPDVLKPYIDQLKQVEAAQGGAGHGMEEFGLKTAAAKRELLVLTHELSQGNFKRFGGSILVLAEQTGAAGLLFSAAAVSAGLLVGAIGAVAFAASKGAKELQDFQNAATLNGNAIGLSASRFTELRDSLSGIATKGKAAEVLTEIAKSGIQAGAGVKSIAEAAVLMEKATGQSVEKTIGQFAELAKSPVEASAKLNEQYNFLTTAVFKQIKALEDQGKAVQAANLAETTYAETMKARASSVVDSAGTIEKAWRGITGTAKAAWDAMLNIGRDQSPAEKLAANAANIASLQTRLSAAGTFSTTSSGAAVGGVSASRKSALEQQLEQAKQLQGFLQEQVRQEKQATDSKVEQNRLQQLGIDFTKQGDQFLTKQQQREKELLKARTEGQELVNAGIITQQQLTERLNGIKQKYNETTGQSEVAAILARNIEQKELLARLQGQIASGGRDTAPTALTDNEKAVVKLQKELETGLLGVARAQKEKALAAAQAGVQTDKDVVAAEKQLTALKALNVEHDRQVEAVSQQAEAIRAQAIGQEAANAAFGKSKTAIEQATLAQLKLQFAEADSSDSFDPKYVAALALKTEAQQRYVAALQQTELKQANLHLDEAARVAGEETASLQLQVSLLGKSQEERAVILSQRKAEIDLAKELVAIDKLNVVSADATDQQKQDAADAIQRLKDKARANSVVEANNAASKAVLDQWQRTADSINNALTDALLNGFNSGQTFAQNLRDALVNMFKTLVLRPIIQGVLAPVSGLISSGVSSLIGGGGQGSGVFGTANNALSIYNGGGNTLSVGSQVLGGSMSVSNGLGTLYANGTTTGSGTALDALLKTNGAYGTAAPSGGASELASAIGPFTALAAVFLAAYQDGFFSGDKRTGGRFATDANGNAQLVAQSSGAPSQPDVTKGIIDATVGGINDAFSVLGINDRIKGFQAAYETSTDGSGRGGVYAGGTLTSGKMFGESGQGDNYDWNNSPFEMVDSTALNRYMKTEAEATKEFALDLKQATLQALQSVVGIDPKVTKVTSMADYTDENGQPNGSQFIKTDTVRIIDQVALAAADQLGLLPKKILDLIKGVDFETQTETEVDRVLGLINTMIGNVKGFRQAVEAFPVGKLKDMGFDAAAALVEVSGGLEAFTNNLHSYFDNFYSDVEKRQVAAQQIARTLQSAGLNVSSDQVLNASRATFRAVVDSLDVTTTAGQKAFTALMSVAGAFANITPAANAAADASQTLAGLSSATDAALSAVERAIAAQQQTAQAAVQAATEQRDAVQAVFDTLKSGIDSLYGAANPQAQGNQGQDFISQALATAQSSGYLPDSKDLSTAIQQAIGGIGNTVYASEVDRQRAQLVLAGQLSQLKDKAGFQLSVADQQLKAAQDQLTALDRMLQSAKDQVDALRGINAGVLSLTDALAALGAAIVAEAKNRGVIPPAGPAPTGPANTAFKAQSDALLTAGDRAGAYTFAKDSGVSLAQLDSLYGAPAGTAEDWARANGLPVFDVGTNYVPKNMLAFLHEGESVTPKAYNPAANGPAASGNARTDQLIQALVDEVKQLRGQVAESNQHTRRTADAVNGAPDQPMLVDLALNSGKVTTT